MAPHAPEIRAGREGPLWYQETSSVRELHCQSIISRPGRPAFVCGRRLARANEEVIATGRLLRDLAEVHEGCLGAYCPSCKNVSEFRLASAYATQGAT